MPASPIHRQPSRPAGAVSASAVRGGAVFTCGLLCSALFAQVVLEDARLAAPYVSVRLWQALVWGLGGTGGSGDATSVQLPLAGLLAWLIPAHLIALAAGAWLLTCGGHSGWRHACVRWADRGWRWWLICGAWWLLWNAALLGGWNAGVLFLAQTSELWLSLAMAGWVAAAALLREQSGAGRADVSALPPDLSPPPAAQSQLPAALWIGMALYGLVFTALNWGLWFNLRVPHGDSAMYEEHLWNIEHGKGFRSYLDQGLFLGEHVQVIHVLLLPLHWVWPSHLLLELCQSFALAAGAIPVYRLARRFGGCPRAALLLAWAYLLYFPLQSLDVTIDLKTFRPNSLGVPALLFALEALERGRRGAAVAWLALMLSAQEDYAIVIALLGVWIAATAGAVPEPSGRWSLAARVRRLFARGARKQLAFGAALALFGVAYLLLVMQVVFPFFRDGATIHYASYFAKFGHTPGEIAWTLLTRPQRALAELMTVSSAVYVAGLLVPLGGLPLRSPGRLSVAAPLFGLLCLNELAMQPPAPVHHFHAPLVPLLFWAAAAGLRPSGPAVLPSAAPDASQSGLQRRRARLACLCALTTGLFMSISPLGIRFWDPGSSRHWRALYVPGERARSFRHVEALIPRDARVASTDFVHARLTHRTRSYDYSEYRRRVADYEDRVPHDTDYIVIDIEHPYHRPEQVLALRRDPYTAVRELRTQPEQWELLEHPADRYFIVLRRR